MPFGLKTALTTFEKMMNNVLSSVTGTMYFVFLDDVFIHANSLVDHDRKLRDMCRRLRQYNFKLQPGKCEFLRKEVTFLGHKISEYGVEPDTYKVVSVASFPTLKTLKQLKDSLGLVGYYIKFIPQFSKIAAPLYTLLKKDEKYVGEESQEILFRTLKQKLISQPILQYPGFSREFMLSTDASNDGAGTVLSQGQIGKDLPIAYASPSLNKPERNYSTVEKELAAIVWGIKHFRPYCMVGNLKQ